MEVRRDLYLEKLKAYKWNGQVKIITGLRRCGKSYLLNPIFRNHLLAEGVPSNHILYIELDKLKDIRYRNPLELATHVREIVTTSPDPFYLFVDEIQLSDKVPNPYNPEGKEITFYDALSDLISLSNLDIYVTGSNSKMLSSDILTEFRDRGVEIRMHPLTFSEFYAATSGDKEDAFDEYAFYGGMPLVLSRPDDAAKMAYLRELFTQVYIKDIVERKKITRPEILSAIVDLLASSIGSLTNVSNVTNAINTRQKLSRGSQVSNNTVSSYIGHLEDAFLFHECKRYDVRGKSYFDYPSKYYCEDVGLRNARIGFRQQELTHIMENMIYNELIARGYLVDVGVVFESTHNEKGNGRRIAREIDFIVTMGGKKTYIQSAYAMDTEDKIHTETRPFSIAGDSFPKIVVRRDIRKRWYDENGILNIGIIDFLLSNDVL